MITAREARTGSMSGCPYRIENSIPGHHKVQKPCAAVIQRFAWQVFHAATLRLSPAILNFTQLPDSLYHKPIHGRIPLRRFLLGTSHFVVNSRSTHSLNTRSFCNAKQESCCSLYLSSQSCNFFSTQHLLNNQPVI